MKILRTWPLLTSSQARNLAWQARQAGKGGCGGRVGWGGGRNERRGGGDRLNTGNPPLR